MLLIGRVFAEYGLLLMPVFEVPDLLQFDAHYTAPRGAFWIVRDDRHVVGSVGVDRKDERTAELKRLYVDASLRGRGIGQRLVETVLEWTREEGLARLVLWSDTRFARGHRFYEKLGFQRWPGERYLADVSATWEYHFRKPLHGPA